MIKSNELRIGNYTNKGKIESFYESGIHIGYGKCFGFSELEPIQLTEDILLKCGGERDEHNDVFVYLDKKHDLRLYLTNGFIQQCKSYYSPLSNYPHITHLHQLQNLYFALTQQELNIQL